LLPIPLSLHYLGLVSRKSTQHGEPIRNPRRWGRAHCCQWTANHVKYR